MVDLPVSVVLCVSVLLPSNTESERGTAMVDDNLTGGGC